MKKWKIVNGWIANLKEDFGNYSGDYYSNSNNIETVAFDWAVRMTINMFTVREKSMREAAEAGRRQKEEHRRKEHDEMFKQVREKEKIN